MHLRRVEQSRAVRGDAVGQTKRDTAFQCLPGRTFRRRALAGAALEPPAAQHKHLNDTRLRDGAVAVIAKDLKHSHSQTPRSRSALEHQDFSLNLGSVKKHFQSSLSQIDCRKNSIRCAT